MYCFLAVPQKSFAFQLVIPSDHSTSLGVGARNLFGTEIPRCTQLFVDVISR